MDKSPSFDVDGAGNARLQFTPHGDSGSIFVWCDCAPINANSRMLGNVLIMAADAYDFIDALRNGKSIFIQGTGRDLDISMDGGTLRVARGDRPVRTFLLPRHVRLKLANDLAGVLYPSAAAPVKTVSQPVQEPVQQRPKLRPIAGAPEGAPNPDWPA